MMRVVLLNEVCFTLQCSPDVAGILNPEPEALNPKPQALNPKPPETLNPKRYWPP